tara:strand:+ start:280 stop:570 length:291 start_codon:yes stop_codon:yes gene_type:complete
MSVHVFGVTVYVKFFLLFLIFTGCTRKSYVPRITDTEFDQSKRNWEIVYKNELEAALKNDDGESYYFFWREYLAERYRNKCKKYNKLHGTTCSCKD